MNNYLFQSTEFAVSDNGIHLLRSGFNYKTIRWSEVDSIKIRKGKELNNSWVIFLLGLILLTAGVYLTIRTVDILVHKEHAERYIKMLLFLLIPVIGVYFVYNSMRTGIIMSVNYAADKKEMFPLNEIIRQNRLNEFKSLMTVKLGTRVRP
jgi:hypothetical protein